MKRKGYNEKKDKILQAANTLFLEKGYGSTSVDEILESVKISKGTFYHYFNSKAELLESIIDEFTNSFIIHLRPIVDNKNMSAIEKLNAYYVLNQTMKKENKALFMQAAAVWYKEDNLLYKQRLNKSLIDALTPQVEKILIQGSQEGVFDIIEPYETALLINHLGFSLRDRMLEEFLKKKPDMKKVQDAVKTHQRGVEKILGIPGDSLTIFSSNYLNTI